MRILVSGAAGMIGSHAVDALLARGDEVVAVDDLSCGHKKNVSTQARFVVLDVCDEKAVAKVFDELGPFDGVVHQASIINRGIDEEDVNIDIAVNINATVNLVRNAIKANVRRFVYASSVAVYGRPEVLPAKERETMPFPIASYGIGKLSAEHYVRYLCEETDMTYACLRYSNIYGPRQNKNGEVGVVGVFVDNVSLNKPIVVYGDGQQSRDFLYVSDCVEATLAALDEEGSFVLNIGSGRPTTVMEIVDSLAAACERPMEIVNKPLRHGEIGQFWCDVSQAQAALNWSPKTDLPTGIRNTLQWRTGQSARDE